MDYELKWNFLRKQIQAGINRFDSIFPNTRDANLRSCRDQNAWIIKQMNIIQDLDNETLQQAKLEDF